MARILASVVGTALTLAGCGLLSGPERFVEDCPSGECGGLVTKPVALTQPDSVINQVEFSWENKEDLDFEEVLFDGYYYRANSNTDSLDLELTRDQELETLRNIMEAFETIVITFEQPEREWFEYGENAVPDSLDNVITTKNHADEVWTVYRLIGELLFFNTNPETGVEKGFIVRQRFDFSFRQHVEDGKTLWQLAEWNDRETTFNLKISPRALPMGNIAGIKAASMGAPYLD